MCVLEILYRESAAKREYHRVPEYAKRQQIPVGRPEAQQVTSTKL